ncbi:MAG: hypothetical protein QM817_28515 [Archangium sp.]
MRPALLESLPYPELMERRLRCFTMVDAIVNPEFRAFEWHPKWGRGQRMGAFKDGSGNFFFAWFCKAGAVIRGFDHESVMSPFQSDPPVEWPALFEGLPSALAYAKSEPAFALEEITFACWAKGAEGDWASSKSVKFPRRSADADGSKELLKCFQPNFARWAAEYYGDAVHAKSLKAIWDDEPITRAMLDAMNPEHELAMVKEEAKLCGFRLVK